MISEKARAAFDENKRRRVNLWIRKNNDLLYSVAYRSIDYYPALKVYDWARMKDRIESKGDIRTRKKLGLLKPEPEPFSFTFDEAELFGLTRKQFARAIRELHTVGIIDVVKKGSGRHKDYSLFAWSERWRKYGTEQFQNIPFPQNLRHLPRNPDGTWTSNKHANNCSLPPMADIRNRAENGPCEMAEDRHLKGKDVPLKECIKGRELPLIRGIFLPLKNLPDPVDVDSRESLVADDLEWIGV